MGVDIFHAEFHADFRSGLHFDLRGCISEHKHSFLISLQMLNLVFGAKWNLLLEEFSPNNYAVLLPL